MNELVKVENNQIVVSSDFINDYKKFQELKLKMDLAEKEIKQEVKELIESGVAIAPSEEIKITYRKASTRTTLDSKKLKEDMPDIFEEYSKTSKVTSSVSINVE